METLKDIPGYEGRYAASTEGRIWSHLRKRWLKPYPHAEGYLQVKLSPAKGETPNSLLVHRLVLLTFVGPPPEDNYEGDHRNFVRTDNTLNNLQWVTQQENIQRISQHGHWPDRRGLYDGESHPQSYLTNADVVRIRELCSQKIRHKDIAKTFGITPSHVSGINTRRLWKHI